MEILAVIPSIQLRQNARFGSLAHSQVRGSSRGEERQQWYHYIFRRLTPEKEEARGQTDSPLVTSATSPNEPPKEYLKPARAYSVMFFLTLVIFSSSITNGMITTGLPAIASEIGIPPQTMYWPLAVYSLTAGTCLIAAGTVADVVGTRRVFLTGTILLSAFTLGCSLSRTGLQLTMFRATKPPSSAHPRRLARRRHRLRVPGHAGRRARPAVREPVPHPRARRHRDAGRQPGAHPGLCVVDARGGEARAPGAHPQRALATRDLFERVRHGHDVVRRHADAGAVRDALLPKGAGAGRAAVVDSAAPVAAHRSVAEPHCGFGHAPRVGHVAGLFVVAGVRGSAVVDGVD